MPQTTDVACLLVAQLQVTTAHVSVIKLSHNRDELMEAALVRACDTPATMVFWHRLCDAKSFFYKGPRLCV